MRQRHAILIRKLRRLRDVFLSTARCNERDRARLVSFADDCEESAELLSFLETYMRTADAAVNALLAVDAAKDAKLVEKDATIADLTTKLADAEARAISPETLAKVDAAAPEVQSA